MGLLDKLLGRGKKATGDLVGDSSLHNEGVHQEQAGIAADKAEAHEEAAVEAHVEEAEHRQQAD